MRPTRYPLDAPPDLRPRGVLDPSLGHAAAAPPVLDALGLAYGCYQAHAFATAWRQRFVDGLRPVLWSPPSRGRQRRVRYSS
jgi:hypothetical protein